MDTNKSSMEYLCTDLVCEFPTINEKFRGIKSRYAYLGVYSDNTP
jgi:carotenoid cleavage dioxygenase-like enzyme